MWRMIRQLLTEIKQCKNNIHNKCCTLFVINHILFWIYTSSQGSFWIWVLPITDVTCNYVSHWLIPYTEWSLHSMSLCDVVVNYWCDLLTADNKPRLHVSWYHLLIKLSYSVPKQLVSSADVKTPQVPTITFCNYVPSTVPEAMTSGCGWLFTYPHELNILFIRTMSKAEWVSICQYFGIE